LQHLSHAERTLTIRNQNGKKKMGARIKLIKAYNNYIYDTFNASLIISVMLKRKYFGTFE